MGDVSFTINNEHLSTFKVILDVTDAPDTENPNCPGEVIRPQHVIVTARPEQDRNLDFSPDRWEVDLFVASGPRIHPVTGKLTKRNYDSLFGDPLNPGPRTPKWVAEIAQYWQDRLNQMSGKVEKA